MTIESLEPRRLFAISMDDAGVLTVTGTADNDRVTFFVSGSLVTVTVQTGLPSKFKRFDIADIKKIVVRLKGGDDTLVSDLNKRSVEATVLGASGNEDLDSPASGNTLYECGRGGDSVMAGDGDDTLRGGPGKDTLFGGSGHDRVLGEGGADALNGDAGNDTLVGGPGIDGMRGQGGDDLLNFQDGRSDFPFFFDADGGSGFDRIKADLGESGENNIDLVDTPQTVNALKNIYSIEKIIRK